MVERVSSYDKQRRVKLATIFLDEVILPAISVNEDISLQIFNEKLKNFQDFHPVIGSDFEIEHVWGAAWKRVLQNQEIKSKGEVLPENADLVAKAWNLLTDLQLTETS